MAARRSTRRDDEDALDPVESADVEDDESESEDDDLSDADVDLEDVEVDAEGDELADDDASEPLEVPDGFVTDEEPDDEAEAEVVPLAVFDDDEDETITRVSSEEDEDDEDVDGLRDGEFVCRSCFMAKRESALADAKRLLCRDCA
ncbi:MAG: hypothetical protein KY457_09590 [Actinobacteria bacterium]|nr:hypothetical protein [Actinomycetota bacterium]